MVRSVLSWLADHGSPRNVSGSMHRLQLNLALRYMELGTAQPQVCFWGGECGGSVEGSLHRLPLEA